MDDAGLATKVALFPMIFANGLRLPFYHLIRNVLDLLDLEPAQLHPNAWMLLVASCVIFLLVLNPEFEEYLNLTAGEFLSVYMVLHLEGTSTISRLTIRGELPAWRSAFLTSRTGPSAYSLFLSWAGNIPRGRPSTKSF